MKAVSIGRLRLKWVITANLAYNMRRLVWLPAKYAAA
jgi:hypothetical protein